MNSDTIHNETHWTEGFGHGLDYYGTDGGLENGKITIRFRNDEYQNRSYLNIRVKYRQKQSETSYLCAIDGSFSTNSPIGFAVKSLRNDNDWYRIQSIAVSACSGYWEIPTSWCENEEPSWQWKYALWSNSEWFNFTQYQYDDNNTVNPVAISNHIVHGIFYGEDVIQQTFGPLVEHEVVTMELDLWYRVGDSVAAWWFVVPDGLYIQLEVNEIVFTCDVPDNATICDGDWSEVVHDEDDQFCTKRMFPVCLIADFCQF